LLPKVSRRAESGIGWIVMSAWSRVATISRRGVEQSNPDPLDATPEPKVARTPRRTAIAIALVVALAVAAFTVSRGASSSSTASPVASEPEAAHARPAARGSQAAKASSQERPITADLPRALQRTCRANGADHAECGPAGPAVSIDVRRIDDPSAIASGLALVARGLAPGKGDAACAAGAPEVRRWSAPASPRVAAGTYVCRAGNPAEMWWSVDAHHLVAHAVAGDADLAGLFRWWLALDDR
jgi:hypothetical protein